MFGDWSIHQSSLRNPYFLHSINVPRKIPASHIILWWLSFFSQQWKHPTSSLFLKCLVNIFTLATTYKFVYRPCGVMVSTLDFESSDPSSSLGRTSFCIEAGRGLPPCLETASSFNLLYAILLSPLQLMYPERFKLRTILWWFKSRHHSFSIDSGNIQLHLYF